MPRIRFEMKYSKTEREKMEANVLGEHEKNIVPKKRNEFALFLNSKKTYQKGGRPLRHTSHAIFQKWLQKYMKPSSYQYSKPFHENGWSPKNAIIQMLGEERNSIRTGFVLE